MRVVHPWTVFQGYALIYRSNNEEGRSEMRDSPILNTANFVRWSCALKYITQNTGKWTWTFSLVIPWIGISSIKALQFLNINLKYSVYMMYWLFVLILDTERAPVRLVGGSSVNEGRVEVYFNNTWGTVCHDGWDRTDAKVVCRQLGLPYGNAEAVGAAMFGEGFGQIWLHGAPCRGSESFLTECLSYYSWGVHNCDHSKDAGVICKNGKLNMIIMNEIAALLKNEHTCISLWTDEV